MKSRRCALSLLASALVLSACAALAPLRNPPPLAADELIAGLTTRDEAVARLGPPSEVRASDIGTLLVYRRVAVVDANPNRYYGLDRGARLDRYELLLLYVDRDGRIVRWAIEPE